MRNCPKCNLKPVFTETTVGYEYVCGKCNGVVKQHDSDTVKVTSVDYTFDDGVVLKLAELMKDMKFWKGED